MNKFFFTSFAALILLGNTILAQEKYQIGSDLKNLRQTQGAYFDYSDPSGVNIKVQVWGYVKYPGYYIVPINTTLSELFSFAGGPMVDAKLEEIRILREVENESVVMTKYNYNDLMWEENLKSEIKFPVLEAGDIVVVPGEPRYFIRQDISFYLSILTAVISSAALIISITR
ncbi:MAG: SLBB domain-containing protein [Ignavibacterium album]|uniref:SLBB domain-containing protein n=1 Tax=Ignavibacterium album TaxID=591197 RepID=UPI0026F10A92|nr:SLBB domain-containing protein [Ignavibacterium album]MCX8106584.1 SLBB domain-containing protein [Ignavibacterium album]